MNEQECLSRMVSPGMVRPGIYCGGILQIWVTRACDRACVHCTQGSNLRGRPGMISVDQFEQALQSLEGYFGVIGVFGGNPAIHPEFEELCRLMRQYVPFERRGLWCNNPLGKGAVMRKTFNPHHSNINVHCDREAFEEFRRDWPECFPFGLAEDSRHGPCYVAMIDVLPDEEKRLELISQCDINQRWSALVGVFRGEVKGWFCEIAAAQSMLHQYEEDYPDTGLDVTKTYTHPQTGEACKWWQLPMQSFVHQLRLHCHECGVPLRGVGALANDPNAIEQVSPTHQSIYRPKDKTRQVEVITSLEQLGGSLRSAIDYVGNATRPIKDICQ